jgi:nickel-dependent lactate racemase
MIPLPYGYSQLELKTSHLFLNDPKCFLPQQFRSGEFMEEPAIEETLKDFRYDWYINENTSVAIAINDPTRPIPYHLILPPLLRYLLKAGARSENISFFIATGTHNSPSMEELSLIIPASIFENYRTIVHNCDDYNNLEYLGVSKAGTPVYINKRYYYSDIKILTGHIEPHHFMGFSGGYKSAVIGLGGRKTIEANHKLICNPASKMNRFYSNPMRMDVEDIGERIGIDCALNVVLDDTKRIVGVFFDSPGTVMRKGIELSRRISQIDTQTKYDLVICSAGGFPKDINLYQAQKAITHAALFVRDDGVIILAAECRNGFGSEKFRSFIEDHQSPALVIQAFEHSSFCIGPHKAYQLALQAQKFHIILVSELSDTKALESMITVTNNLEQGLTLSRHWLTDQASIAVLPYATHLMNPAEINS